jgi:hypothetical protein
MREETMKTMTTEPVPFPLILILSAAVVLSTAAPAPAAVSTFVPPMPLISSGMAAYASSGDAAQGKSNGPFDGWEGATTAAWLAYDLTAVAPARRGAVVLHWVTPANFVQDTPGAVHPQVADAYAIEANAAAGGTGAAPASGWTTLLNVSGNQAAARVHDLNLAGQNWVRLRVISAGGGSGGPAKLRMKLSDAAAGNTDSWLFIGDSNMFMSMNMASPGWASRVKSVYDQNDPIFITGAIGGTNFDYVIQHMTAYISQFGGRFVAVAHGTNHLPGSLPADQYDQKLRQVVDAILAAGKVPVVAKVLWAPIASYQALATQYNAKIEQLYAEKPQVLRGPDLYALFQDRNDLFAPGDVHVGANVYAQAWTDHLNAAIYGNGGSVLTGPGSLQASAGHGGSVQVVWEDRSSDETGFVLQRSVNGGPFVQLGAVLPAGTESFTDATAAPGVPYRYRVAAQRNAETSLWSNEASITLPGGGTPPPPPPDPVPQGAVGREEAPLLLSPGRGDGVNDSVNFGADVVEAEVFDARGRRVHQGAAWDGLLDGRPAPAGFYAVKVTRRDGSVRYHKLLVAR